MRVAIIGGTVAGIALAATVVAPGAGHAATPDHEVLRALQDAASRSDIAARARGGFRAVASDRSGHSDYWLRRDFRTARAASWLGVTVRNTWFARISPRDAQARRALRLVGAPQARFLRSWDGGVGVSLGFGTYWSMLVLPSGQQSPSAFIAELVPDVARATALGSGRYAVRVKRRDMDQRLLVTFSGDLLRRIERPRTGEMLTFAYGPQVVRRPAAPGVTSANRFYRALRLVEAKVFARWAAQGTVYYAQRRPGDPVTAIRRIARSYSAGNSEVRIRSLPTGVSLTYSNPFGRVRWDVVYLPGRDRTVARHIS